MGKQFTIPPPPIFDDIADILPPPIFEDETIFVDRVPKGEQGQRGYAQVFEQPTQDVTATRLPSKDKEKERALVNKANLERHQAISRTLPRVSDEDPQVTERRNFLREFAETRGGNVPFLNPLDVLGYRGLEGAGRGVAEAIKSDNAVDAAINLAHGAFSGLMATPTAQPFNVAFEAGSVLLPKTTQALMQPANYTADQIIGLTFESETGRKPTQGEFEDIKRSIEKRTTPRSILTGKQALEIGDIVGNFILFHQFHKGTRAVQDVIEKHQRKPFDAERVRKEQEQETVRQQQMDEEFQQYYDKVEEMRQGVVTPEGELPKIESKPASEEGIIQTKPMSDEQRRAQGVLSEEQRARIPFESKKSSLVDAQGRPLENIPEPTPVQPKTIDELPPPVFEEAKPAVSPEKETITPPKAESLNSIEQALRKEIGDEVGRYEFEVSADGSFRATDQISGNTIRTGKTDDINTFVQEVKKYNKNNPPQLRGWEKTSSESPVSEKPAEIPPSFKKEMVDKLTQAGEKTEGLSDADLIARYQEKGLDKPAPISEAPVSQGGDISVRGEANQKQVEQIKKKYGGRPSKYSQISEEDYPTLYQTSKIKPDWILKDGKVVMREEFQPLGDLLDTTEKPTPQQLSTIGGKKYGNIDDIANELGYEDAETYRNLLIDEKQKFDRYGGYISKAKIEEITLRVAEIPDQLAFEKELSELPVSVRRQVEVKLSEQWKDKQNDETKFEPASTIEDYANKAISANEISEIETVLRELDDFQEGRKPAEQKPLSVEPLTAPKKSAEQQLVEEKLKEGDNDLAVQQKRRIESQRKADTRAERETELSNLIARQSQLRREIGSGLGTSEQIQKAKSDLGNVNERIGALKEQLDVTSTEDIFNPKEDLFPQEKSEQKPPESAKPQPSIPEPSTGKEAWEMTRGDFIEQGGKVLGAKRDKDFTFRYDWRVESQKLGEEHKQGVEKTLSEGKPVPQEVLADYPDLQQKGKGEERTPTFDTYKDIRIKLKKKDYGAEELKKDFQYYIDNKDAITKSIREWLDTSPDYKRKRPSTKDEIAQKSYDQTLESFAYAGYGGLTYSMGFGKDFAVKKLEAIKKQVESTTDEMIGEQRKKSEEMKKSFEEYKGRVKQAIENPQTLEDFNLRKQYKAPELKPEQRERYEDLYALDQKKKRIESQIVDVSTVGEHEIKADKDTRDNPDIWVVTPKQRLSSEAFNTYATAMRQLGGYYSRFKRGFVFKEDPTGKLGGTEKVEFKQKVHSDRLRETADNMQETIDKKLDVGGNRLENTARRARMGDSQRADGEYMKRIQQTMRNIADALDGGDIALLDKISARTEIEQLDSILGSAKQKRWRAEGGKSNEQFQNTPIDTKTVSYAEMPTIELSFSDGLKLADALGRSSITAKQIQKLIRQKRGATYEYIDITPIYQKVINALEKTKTDQYLKDRLEESAKNFRRLEKLGIETTEELRAYLREYIKYRKSSEGQTEADRIRAKERELLGTKIEGYFPTPKPLVERMLEEADIQDGMKVLEPSAGKGNIADAIRDEYPSAGLSVIEQYSTLRDILELKKHNLVGNDFLQSTEKQDRIVMNPPFENLQDVDHVRHAYDLLNPGGKLVSIMSESPFFRSDKKAQEFRDWLETVGGTSEKNPEGSFKTSERPTGVATRLVTIEKPKDITEEQPKQDLKTQYAEILKRRLKGSGFENDMLSPVYRNASQDAFNELKKVTGRNDINFGDVLPDKPSSGTLKSFALGTAYIASNEAINALPVDDERKKLLKGLLTAGVLGAGMVYAPKWFLKSAKALAEAKQSVFTAGQAGGLFKEIKAEEMKWTGLDDFIREKERTNSKVTKEELQRVMDEGRIEVKEVVKGDSVTANARDKYNRFVESLQQKYKQPTIADIKARELLTKNEEQKLNELWDNVKNQRAEDTKFSSYQLPGGENYKELLLTLPERGSDTPNGWTVLDRDGIPSLATMNQERAIRRAQEIGGTVQQDFAPDKSQNFHSSHFDEPNIFAHIRFNDRTVNGKKILFLEEVQSDWHQSGRKSGYSEPTPKWEVFDAKTGDVVSRFEKEDDAVREVNKRDDNGKHYLDYRLSEKRGGVPDAPFKKDWQEVAFRRMVRYASENGYDGIAWTKGKDQIDRYNQALRQNVDRIDYAKVENGGVNILASKDGKASLNEIIPLEGKTEISGKMVTLDDVVGKSLAEQIRNSKDQNGFFEGDNLAIGGEGMQGFYDKMLPEYAKKFGKKFGAIVSQINIGKKNLGEQIPDGAGGLVRKGEKTEPVEAHFIPITEPMRKSALSEGMNLFSIGANLAGHAFIENSDLDDDTKKKFLGILNALTIAGIGGTILMSKDAQRLLADIRSSVAKRAMSAGWSADQIKTETKKSVDSFLKSDEAKSFSAKDVEAIKRANETEGFRAESAKFANEIRSTPVMEKPSKKFENDRLLNKMIEVLESEKRPTIAGERKPSVISLTKGRVKAYILEAEQNFLKGNDAIEFVRGKLINDVQNSPELKEAPPSSKLTVARRLSSDTVKRWMDFVEKEQKKVSVQADIDARNNRVKEQIADRILNAKLPKKDIEKFLALAQKYRVNEDNQGKFMAGFKSRISVMVDSYGPGGGELTAKMYQGDLNRSQLMQHGETYINKIRDVLDEVKGEFSLDRRDKINDEVIKALENREIAEKVLTLPESKEVYSQAKEFLDYFRELLKQRGYQTRENYFTHIKDVDIIEQVLNDIKDARQEKVQNLNEFITDKSRFLKPREEADIQIRRDIPSVLSSYLKSVSKELAYRDGVEYYYSRFLKDVPVALKNNSTARAIKLMKNVLEPEKGRGIFYRGINFIRSNQYRNFLGMNLKASAQNMTQPEFARLRWTDEADALQKKMWRRRDSLTGALADAVDLASQETPRFLELIKEEDSRQSPISQWFSRIDTFQKSEAGNWGRVELGSILNSVMKDPRYKEMKAELGQVEAINKLLEDKDVFDKAVRESAVTAAETQVASAPSMRGEFFDRPLNRVIGMFTAFKFRQLQTLGEALQSYEGIKGTRAQSILRRGLSGEVEPVEVLREIETNRVAMEKILKDAKAGKRDIGQDNLAEMIDYLKTQEKELNSIIKDIEPLTGSKVKTARNLMRYYAKITGISIFFSVLWDTVDNAVYGDEDKDKNMLAKAIKKAAWDIAPTPFYGMNPSKFLVSPVVPNLENAFPYGNFSGRGLARDVTSYGLNMIPFAGLADRASGKRLSKAFVDVVAPKKEKTLYQKLFSQ